MPYFILPAALSLIEQSAIHAKCLEIHLEYERRAEEDAYRKMRIGDALEAIHRNQRFLLLNKDARKDAQQCDRIGLMVPACFAPFRNHYPMEYVRVAAKTAVDWSKPSHGLIDEDAMMMPVWTFRLVDSYYVRVE